MEEVNMNKLFVYTDRCNGCKRCELACMDAHREIDGDSPKTRIFVESTSGRPVPVVCRHCKDALCVSACMSGCMQKDTDTGIVSNMGHYQKCVGCWMCLMVCPFGVIVPSDEDAFVKRYGFAQAIKCDLCKGKETPACVAACPNYALELRNVDAE